MSWSINYIGTRPAVKAKIIEDAKQGYIPQGIVDTVVAIAEDTNEHSSNGIRVEGSGHSGGGYGSINSLKVEAIPLLGVPEIWIPKPAR